MNAGYVGYYNRLNIGANDMLSMSVFKIKGNQVTETVSDPAVWELMYFGKSCADENFKAKSDI